jgi:HemY protein
MARIEAAEHGDTGLAREWMARAVHAAQDPAWTADGAVAETWMPISPVTGRLDAFEWRVPVAELTPRGRLIEQAAPLKPVLLGVGAQSAGDAAPETPPTGKPEPKPALRPNGPLDEAPVHLPDDPGPVAEHALDPVPQPASGDAGARPSWFPRGSLK